MLQADPNVRKRNQRMFGALLGTLQKFKCASASRINVTPLLLLLTLCYWRRTGACVSECQQLSLTGRVRVVSFVLPACPFRKEEDSATRQEVERKRLALLQKARINAARNTAS